MTAPFTTNAHLYNDDGQRLYLCESEDIRFLAAASRAEPSTRLFCELLSYTGCRISEALATTPRLLDAPKKDVMFRTLKRRKLIYRSVPVPERLMHELILQSRGLGPDDRLWSWSRQTGWRRIKEVLLQAGITGKQAMPKGIRHAYGINAIMHGLPETLLQEMLGHANISTTGIYTRAAGREKRALVSRMW